MLQDHKWTPITATYTVLTPEGMPLGRMRKNYLYNIFRKKWSVHDPDANPILIAREDSLILSLLRRFLGPLFGLLRTNFVLLTPGPDGQEQIRGEFNRKLTIFDRYVLDVTGTAPGPSIGGWPSPSAFCSIPANIAELADSGRSLSDPGRDRT